MPHPVLHLQHCTICPGFEQEQVMPLPMMGILCALALRQRTTCPKKEQVMPFPLMGILFALGAHQDTTCQLMGMPGQRLRLGRRQYRSTICP